MATKKKEQQESLSMHNLYQTTVSGYKDVLKRMISNLPPDKCPAMIGIGAVGIGKTESETSLFHELREAGVVKSNIIRHLRTVATPIHINKKTTSSTSELTMLI